MIVCGVDEAGRGALAGPVVAAAVVLPCLVKQAWMEDIHLYDNGIIRDSKRMTPKQRKKAAETIFKVTRVRSISFTDNHYIDKYNILQATFAAMRGALRHASCSLEQIGIGAIDLVLVDGPFKIPNIDIKQEAIKHGDSLKLEIAAASIIAKVHRDRIMEGYHRVYPQYRFDKHKGYGTKEHLELIKIHGPCPIHRLTFAGVKEYDPRSAV
jgi:ribonuclease HII